MTTETEVKKEEKDKATDRKLPSDSFLVTYKVEEKFNYDIVRSGSPVEIFDHYYDKYKNVEGIVWTEGVVSPRSFDNVNVEKPAKRKRKK